MPQPRSAPFAAPLAAALAAALCLPAWAAAAPTPAPAPRAKASRAQPTERIDKGVRFLLPAGYAVEEKLEHEPGELNDRLYLARRGRSELRVEVEQGAMHCTPQGLAGAPQQLAVGGRPACQTLTDAPPSLDPKIGQRRSAVVLVQFGDRYLSVFALAPTDRAALALARAVAESAAEVAPAAR
ncbi:MAG: hypothetical protein IPO09_00955 [Anaeromyxobacter sp.]|nr:hypothetical protein [Anaeromyxobacter sp.]MBL0278264.1 hypothetical protein [Anaeromyxobacter sp.]